MRLRRSDVSGPGFVRRRSGRGFRYLDGDARPLSAQDRQRCQDLVIPPAWREVWISPWPNGHIQATGLDEAGRRQYLYHEQWRRQRDEQKFDRVLELAPLLPDFRKAVEVDLAGRGFTCQRVLAVALRMLDHGVFRTGGEQYAEQNGTHGVATLLREQVRVQGTTVAFDYPAKGSIDREFSLVDPALAKVVSGLRRARSGRDRLLVYRDGRQWREVHADDINVRFKELVGDPYSVKDLRTWNATVLAAAELSADRAPGSNRGRRRTETEMYRTVAHHLGNTPAVARKSYVDPRLVEHYEQGETIGKFLRGKESADLADDRVRSTVERGVCELLTGSDR